MGVRLLQVPVAYGTAGNTLVHVAAMLSACHREAGGLSAVALSDNRDARVDGADNLLVDYSEYCPREWFTRPELLVDMGCGTLGLRRPYSGRLFVPAVAAARGWHPDVILLYEGHTATSLPYWRDAFPEASLWIYVHSSPSRSILGRELRRLVALSDGVICVSNATSRALCARLPGKEDAVFVVQNGVDLEFFSPGPAPKPTDVFEAVFVGQVSAHKGPHLLIQAMARAAELTAVPLLTRIVGSGTYDGGMALGAYERSLRDLAAEGGPTVAFVPFVGRETLREYYRGASVLCVPSIVADPFPLVVMEAMACGTGVVASRMGGLPEAGGKAAIYVDPRDTEAFARLLVGLAESPAHVAELGAAGLARARSRSWTAAYDELMGVVSRGRHSGRSASSGRRDPSM